MLEKVLRQIRRNFRFSNVITGKDLNRGVLDVEIDHVHGGFFAQLNWCLYVFAYAMANSVAPRVSLVSRNYNARAKKRDWFQDYFRYNTSLRSEGLARIVRKKRIYHFSELGFTIDPDLTIRQAHNIFFETVTVRNSIRDEVDNFVQTNFVGNRMLGIHYRGTDKAAEAPKVNYERVEGHLDSLLETGRFLGVFVASDEQHFIDFLRKKMTSVPIVTRNDSRRSLSGNPLHSSEYENLRLREANHYINKIGLDALTNCMLLSRCHSVLRTSSFLSAWSSIFNPGLRVYLLNRPYSGKFLVSRKGNFENRNSIVGYQR